ncbi:hypothetical protein [Halomonas organivorans]|uniref:Uncharacterized protein n=1 Tax=Halomonas organivorans TaxID=257772 RepID=A0A7W5C0G4_9GAMM|nr:hypothetical protein [Halomonas organivorans]MBB3142585.1 hypothetical protein [Halomonas organivorans]
MKTWPRWLYGLCLVLLWQGFQAPAMADNAENLYFAHVHTQGSAWSLRVNDIFVRDNSKVAYADYSPSIGMEVREGRNTLSLLFSPVTGKNDETGEYEYALHDGVEIDIAIERNHWKTQDQERLHLLRLRYNEDSGRFESLDETAGGEPRQLSQAHMRSSGDWQLGEYRNIIFGGGWTLDGYRLDIHFRLDDAISPPDWRGRAVELEDTPQLRRELREAYRRIYGMIERGDGEAIFQELEPIWQRAAYMLTTESSARAFIEEGELGLARYRQNRPDGAVLLPEPYWEGSPEDDQVEFMANNRLVRIRPNPILWERPPEGSENFIAFPVAFYRTQDGKWHVGDVVNNL